MPTQFHGAALKMTAPQARPIPAAPPAPISTTPPKPPTPPAPKPAPQQPPKKGGGGLIMLIILLVVLVAGAVGGILYFRGKKPAPPAATTPTPPAAVCGDGKCDATETNATCPQDCAPPPAVCGNGSCEATETATTCPQDCQPPAPVCGDGKCDAPETGDSCPQDCKPPAPTAGLDSDSDGLTDVEETTIYGTNPTAADSDGDTYPDGTEVTNLYDPASLAPSPLSNNKGIASFPIASLGITTLYPVKWTTRVDDAAKQAFITAPTGEFIEILAQDLPAGQSLTDWFVAQTPGAQASAVAVQKTRKGLDVIWSADQFTAYVSDGKRVFVVSYNLKSATMIQFHATFQMVAESLSINKK